MPNKINLKFVATLPDGNTFTCNIPSDWGRMEIFLTELKNRAAPIFNETGCIISENNVPELIGVIAPIFPEARYKFSDVE